MNFIDYCNYVGNVSTHLIYAHQNNLLTEDGCRAYQGYLRIEETLDFCDSFEDLKNLLPLEQFTKDFGDLEVFKPLLRKLNNLAQTS